MPPLKPLRINSAKEWVIALRFGLTVAVMYNKKLWNMYNSARKSKPNFVGAWKWLYVIANSKIQSLHIPLKKIMKQM